MVIQTKLANGTTVLIDQDTRFSSASVAICILGGVRAETLEQNGITHLLEHMLFKRTMTKSARQLAEFMDALGGDVNAFTDADSFCLHGTVGKDSVSELLGLFSELLFEFKIDEDELALEKEVIRQEILESLDDPHDAVYQKFTEVFWPGSPLAWPVFGTLKNLEKFQPDSIAEVLKQSLVGNRIIVAVSGNIDSAAVSKQIESIFAGLATGSRLALGATEVATGFAKVEKPVGQIYFTLGIPWPNLAHPDYLRGVAVSSIFGGCMSSRLFQSVREENGLVYGIDADSDAHLDTAALHISANVEPKNFEQLFQLLRSEIVRLQTDGVTEEEVVRIKKMLLTHTEMERDSVSSLLWRMVESEMVFGRQVDREEIKKQLENLSVSSLNEFIKTWWRLDKWAAVFGGNVNEMVPSEDLDAICCM